VTDAGMAMIACPTCGVLRIPPEKLAHEHVEPDPIKPLSVVMRVLFGMRLLWLKSEVPALRNLDTRILDVGCGDGQFLQYLGQRGYRRLAGVEPDAARSANARRRGLPVFDSFEAARTAGAVDDQVDLMLSWHVLEHVTRPADFMRAYVQLLAPGGTMLVSVPNQASIQTRLFGQFSAFPDYGRHLWYHHPGYRAWFESAVPSLKVGLVRDRNYEYEIFSWVESVISRLTRMPCIVNNTLKKGQGGAVRKLLVAVGSAALLPFSAILAPISIAMGRPSTLTFSLRRP
jgi:SAM-dependent methyltransferase